MADPFSPKEKKAKRGERGPWTKEINKEASLEHVLGLEEGIPAPGKRADKS